MTELIEEDKEYEDKGNYGHLCNILPTIAIDEILQRQQTRLNLADVHIVDAQAGLFIPLIYSFSPPFPLSLWV